MNSNVDQYVMVYDFDGCGYSNFSVAAAKMLMPYMQVVYCDRQFCTCLIRLNWAIRAVKSLVMPFLHERTLAKFRIFGSDWEEKLKELVSEDNLPKMYGGTADVDDF